MTKLKLTDSLFLLFSKKEVKIFILDTGLELVLEDPTEYNDSKFSTYEKIFEQSIVSSINVEEDGVVEIRAYYYERNHQ